MAVPTIVWTSPRAHDGVGYVNEGVSIPTMRPRRGLRGTDQKLSAALTEALEELAGSDCSFWACEGPDRPRGMVTCVKCWAMRRVAMVKASLDARTEDPAHD